MICGKICSGKSYYAKQLQKKNQSVILSIDEATYDLMDNEQGEFYDIFVQRVNVYLRKKAMEIVNAGADVILDWGFWSSKDRAEISNFLKANNIQYEWHYVDADDNRWKNLIKERNAKIEKGCDKSNFYLDEELMNKLLSLFEKPHKEDMDIWYVNN